MMSMSWNFGLKERHLRFCEERSRYGEARIRMMEAMRGIACRAERRTRKKRARDKMEHPKAVRVMWLKPSARSAAETEPATTSPRASTP